MGSRKPKSSKGKSSKAQQRKRSRRNKSKKKPSRYDDSILSYSDDDSVSSVSSYSSSSDEDYRSRKGRSHSRADVKSKKKRAERRVSSSQESSEDSVPLRKRRRSQRKHHSEYKRKPQKKRRRDASVSSATNDSLSCSSCQYGSSSSNEEAEYERLRVRSRKKIRDKRGLDKHKVGAQRSRSKSANSPSSEGRSNFHSVSQKGEEHESEKNVRRLRSVITVVEHPQENEENQVGRDHCNEENVSENNDCDNGARENKLVYHSEIVSDKSRSVQDMTVQGSFVLKNVIDGPTKSGKSGANHCRNQAETKSLGETEKVGRVNDSMVSVNATTSGSDDLELILRQKALENLRKFRGKFQGESNIAACQKVKNDLEVNQPSKSEIVRNMLPKQEGSKDVHLTSIVGQSSRHGLSKEVLHPTIVESDNAAEECKKAESGVTKQSHIQQSDMSALSKSVNREGHINAPAVDDESETGIQAMQHDSSCTYLTLKQASPNANSLDGKSSAGKILPESCRPLTHGSSDKLEMEAINAKNSAKAEPTSSIRTLEEQSSKDQQAEAKDSSQFQQKTMSVMRSGEMVQVSYKVYIPKRAPALTRRQLKR